MHPELAGLLALQPYIVVLDGLVLRVGEDVFPPDLGRCARNLARVCGEYRARCALDMGCGSGYLALVLAQLGVGAVWAADVHDPAVACARGNVARNQHAGPVTVVRSDLFEAMPASLRFDLIVFNQPFAPSAAASNGVCGCGPDGGHELTRRFLRDARTRLAPDGVVVMPFSDRAPPAHDPMLAARELGLEARTLLHAHYAGANNFIHEFRPAET